MAKSIADDIKVDITCTQCSKSFKEPVSRLQKNPELACPSCGHRIKVQFKDSGLKQNFAEIDRVLAGFGKSRK